VFKILIDTSVWLDLAKDYHQQPLLSALEQLVQHGDVQLILPRIVVDEFARNKARIAKESGQSLSSNVKRVKDFVEKYGDPRKKRGVLRELADVDHRIPTLGGAAVDSIRRIEELFAKTPVVETSDSVKLRAAERAIDKRAPFHRQNNGMADAVLIEIYADVASERQASTRYAFVSHNTKDFGHPAANANLPHPDLAGSFSRVRSLYFTKLGAALRRADPHAFADLMIESEWLDEPRRLNEIVDAIDVLWDQVWYTRHQVMIERVGSGEMKVVEKETFPVKDHRTRPLQRDVLKAAREAAKRVEKRRGVENLGPWDTFEWGMINGKLSALRWVLGDEWDFLDT
jgi:hypothetical protein